MEVSIDNKKLQSKPVGTEVADISRRIGRNTKQVKPEDIRSFVQDVSINGQTFCPATFKNGIRNKENFIQQQLFALDFDNKNPQKRVSLEEIKNRAESYELPVFFAYDTLSSTDHDKFRVVFLNDTSVTDIRVAEAMQLAMGTIFPEADPSCYKDVSKMYFGGKELLHYDERIPTINVESVFRNLSYYLRKKHKDNHYKEHISRFSKESGIALNRKGFLDVTVSDDLTEIPGASVSNLNGKNSPSVIIFEPYIIASGEIFPEKYYHIRFNEDKGSTKEPSVSKTDDKNILKNHDPYDKSVLLEMNEKCRLFREFETGEKDLDHSELFGIATNLIQVTTGSDSFMKIRRANPDFYTPENNNRWENHLFYMKQNGYKPERCDRYCPYRKDCIHGKDILKTVHPKRGTMEKLSGYNEQLHPLEDVQKDTYDAICNAYYAGNKQFQIVDAMTGAGKSHSYLKLMSKNPDDSFIVAAPTNLLKDELYHKAKRMGINVMKTPSLEQIKDKIPHKIWKHIQQFYKRGMHRQVHSYIHETLKKEDIPCLRKYMEKREKLKTFKGSIITTHRYLLSMDKDRLSDYDAIIIDEDIIFKSIISNQGEITISELKKLSKRTSNDSLKGKIKKLLKLAEKQSCIKLNGFEWDDNESDENDKSMPLLDIPSFCLAERFYVRRKEKEKNLKEDTIAFLKPADFQGEKYIMVSATVNEDICRGYFGENNVDFYECKKAKYKGKLNQYPGKSMSRTSVANNPGIIQRLMNRFGMDGSRVITFMKEGIGQLHFGNTEGSNTLEGKDILVVGTPYHAEFLYKLVAFAMDMDFDEEEVMKGQKVIHNGYQFWFTTFENEDLRSVHFWMIESELEQAVGRARLLRNACNVHLFSNFPLSQSKMVENFDYKKD